MRAPVTTSRGGPTPTSQSGVQAESWGPGSFAVISTGHLPAPVCLEPGQAEQKYALGYKQQSIYLLKFWDNLQGSSLKISK